MLMKIGIDARTILNPSKCNAIGAGHYTYQLIRHILDQDKENEYVLFFDFRVREKDIKKFSRPNTKIVFYPFSDYKKFLPGAYNEILGAATLNKEKLDLLHVTSAKERIPTSYKGKMIVTINDLSALVVPEALPRVRRTRDKAVISYMAKKATRVITSSQSVCEGLTKHLQVDAGNMSVIYSGVDQRFFDDGTHTQKVIKKFDITKKYILFLGTLEPTKNIARLMHAFALFKEERLQKTGKKYCDHQLVLAGKRGWLAQEFKQIAKDLGITKDIVFTGYVIGDELLPLFKHAEYFVLPSLYEGFGTTLLEAFATGTPSIAARVGSLPEIAGDAAYFVDPINTKEVAAAMARFSEDEELRESYRQKGLARAQEFDWDKTAKETLTIYKEVASL